MLTIEADIYEYVRMSYVDKNILGPLVHMGDHAFTQMSVRYCMHFNARITGCRNCEVY